MSDSAVISNLMKNNRKKSNTNSPIYDKSRRNSKNKKLGDMKENIILEKTDSSKDQGIIKETQESKKEFQPNSPNHNLNNLNNLENKSNKTNNTRKSVKSNNDNNVLPHKRKNSHFKNNIVTSNTNNLTNSYTNINTNNNNYNYIQTNASNISTNSKISKKSRFSIISNFSPQQKNRARSIITNTSSVFQRMGITKSNYVTNEAKNGKTLIQQHKEREKQLLKYYCDTNELEIQKLISKNMVEIRKNCQDHDVYLDHFCFDCGIGICKYCLTLPKHETHLAVEKKTFDIRNSNINKKFFGNLSDELKKVLRSGELHKLNNDPTENKNNKTLNDELFNEYKTVLENKLNNIITEIQEIKAQKHKELKTLFDSNKILVTNFDENINYSKNKFNMFIKNNKDLIPNDLHNDIIFLQNFDIYTAGLHCYNQSSEILSHVKDFKTRFKEDIDSITKNVRKAFDDIKNPKIKRKSISDIKIDNVFYGKLNTKLDENQKFIDLFLKKFINKVNSNKMRSTSFNRFINETKSQSIDVKNNTRYNSKLNSNNNSRSQSKSKYRSSSQNSNNNKRSVKDNKVKYVYLNSKKNNSSSGNEISLNNNKFTSGSGEEIEERNINNIYTINNTIKYNTELINNANMIKEELKQLDIIDSNAIKSQNDPLNNTTDLIKLENKVNNSNVNSKRLSFTANNSTNTSRIISNKNKNKPSVNLNSKSGTNNTTPRIKQSSKTTTNKNTVKNENVIGKKLKNTTLNNNNNNNKNNNNFTNNPNSNTNINTKALSFNINTKKINNLNNNESNSGLVIKSKTDKDEAQHNNNYSSLNSIRSIKSSDACYINDLPFLKSYHSKIYTSRHYLDQSYRYNYFFSYISNYINYINNDPLKVTLLVEDGANHLFSKNMNNNLFPKMNFSNEESSITASFFALLLKFNNKKNKENVDYAKSSVNLKALENKTDSKINKKQGEQEGLDLFKPIEGTSKIQLYDSEAKITFRMDLQSVFEENENSNNPADVFPYKKFPEGLRSIMIGMSIYIFGGKDVDNEYSDILKYDIIKQKLYKVSKMSYPRSYFSLIYDEGREMIYLIGGENNKSCERFSLKKRKCFLLPFMNNPRANPSLYLHKDSLLYVFGGFRFGLHRQEKNSSVERLWIDNYSSDDDFKKHSYNCVWEKVKILNEGCIDLKYDYISITPFTHEFIFLCGGFVNRKHERSVTLFDLTNHKLSLLDNSCLNMISEKLLNDKNINMIFEEVFKK